MPALPRAARPARVDAPHLEARSACAYIPRHPPPARRCVCGHVDIRLPPHPREPTRPPLTPACHAHRPAKHRTAPTETEPLTRFTPRRMFSCGRRIVRSASVLRPRVPRADDIGSSRRVRLALRLAWRRGSWICRVAGAPARVRLLPLPLIVLCDGPLASYAPSRGRAAAQPAREALRAPRRTARPTAPLTRRPARSSYAPRARAQREAPRSAALRRRGAPCFSQVQLPPA
jgi:hypothetical protein